MSDRQKGIDPALDEQLPEVQRRICARHLYANLKAEFGGGELLKANFWTASKANNEFVFKKAMESIKTVSKEAHAYLMDVPLELWDRHKFNTSVKVPEVTNNFTECLNGKLSDLREKPMLTMLEGIRRRVMKKIEKKRADMAKWEAPVCPKVKKWCDWAWHDGFYCIPNATGNGLYEVKDGVTYFSVDLGAKKCDCCAWQNMGVPCKHAASAIRHTRGTIKAYVHPYFTKETYKLAYQGVIHPIPDPSMWPEDDNPTLDPPELVRREVGQECREEERKMRVQDSKDQLSLPVRNVASKATILGVVWEVK